MAACRALRLGFALSPTGTGYVDLSLLHDQGNLLVTFVYARVYAFFAWGSFCVAHMRANPDWVRSRRSHLDDEEGAPEAKCVPSPTVSSAAAVEGKASHHGTVNPMAELASKSDAVSPPSVKLTMDDQPSSAQSSPPSTRSKAKKKNSTK